MVLVDTCIWVDHLRQSDPAVSSLLHRKQVLVHPFVIGELALGNLKPGSPALHLLFQLPHAVVADHDEVMGLIQGSQLSGKGIGYVDAALLASVKLTPATTLLTRDQRLHEIASAMGVARRSTLPS